MAQHDDKPSEAQVRLQRKWQEADAKELDNAVSAMLQHKETRRYLYWLFEITNCIGQNPYRLNFGDTAFACGEQNIGQQVMSHLLECAPEGFLLLLKERADERRSRQDDIAGVRSGQLDREPTDTSG